LVQVSNSDPPEAEIQKGKIYHESIPPWREKHEKIRDSMFRVFVMEEFFHKMQRNSN